MDGNSFNQRVPDIYSAEDVTLSNLSTITHNSSY